MLPEVGIDFLSSWSGNQEPPSTSSVVNISYIVILMDPSEKRGAHKRGVLVSSLKFILNVLYGFRLNIQCYKLNFLLNDKGGNIHMFFDVR